MASYFAKDSIVRRVNNEPALNLMAGRALLLQLAHPAVAQGVADHSEFQRNAFKRLQGTLEAMYSIVNGSEELALGIGRRVHWIHTFVVGPSYQANRAENLLWVHATLLDSALLGYTTFVGALEPAEEEAYYREMQRVAEPFGLARSDQPATLAEFRAYFDDAVAHLAPTDVARKLIGDILEPRLPGRLHVPLTPALALHRLITVGTIPANLRAALGLTWNGAQQQRLERWQRALRFAFRAQPRAVRTLPTWLSGRVLLRQAGRHVAEFDARHGALREDTAA